MTLCGGQVVTGSDIFIFGGANGEIWFNDLHILDKDQFSWSAPTVKGTPTPFSIWGTWRQQRAATLRHQQKQPPTKPPSFAPVFGCNAAPSLPPPTYKTLGHTC